MLHCLKNCFKRHNYILIIIGVLAYFALIIAKVILYIINKDYDNSNIDVVIFGLDIAMAFLMALFTALQLYFLYRKLIYDEMCTYSKLKKGAKECAKIIDEYKPTLIILTNGNSFTLFNDYIKKNMSYNDYKIIKLQIHSKTYTSNLPNSIIENCIDTPKFLIEKFNVSNDNISRIIIFDDVILTGSTMAAIYEKLQKDEVPDKQIFKMSFVCGTSCCVKDAIPGYSFINANVRDNYKFLWRD